MKTDATAAARWMMSTTKTTMGGLVFGAGALVGEPRR